MTSTLARVAWVVVQVCYLPIAPARYLHDYLGYLMARRAMPDHVEDVELRRIGYRLDWSIEFAPDASPGAKRSVLLLPVLIGLGVFSVLSPFWKAVWFVPLDQLQQLAWIQRAALELLVLQALALPWPRARDLGRWRAWMTEEETSPTGVVDG